MPESGYRTLPVVVCRSQSAHLHHEEHVCLFPFFGHLLLDDELDATAFAEIAQQGLGPWRGDGDVSGAESDADELVGQLRQY